MIAGIFMPEEESKKHGDRVTRKDLWKPDETQMYRIYEGLTRKSFEESKEKKPKSEKSSE